MDFVNYIYRRIEIWFLLMILGVCLVLFGLYIQYALNYDPCVNCVYERLCFFSYIFAGVIGFVGSSQRIVRFFIYAVLFIGSFIGLIVAYNHIIDVFYPTLGQACSLTANFFLIPFDEIFPFIFKPTGLCEKLDWTFLGLDIPIWVLISFSCSLIFALLGIVSEFVVLAKEKKIKKL